MRRVILLLLMAVIAVVLLYLSRFWFLNLWGRGDFFDLPARGGLLGRWLRGTQFAPFELLIWASGAFIVLTWVQKLTDWISPLPEHDHQDGDEDDK